MTQSVAWLSIPPDLREELAAALTPKQLDALQLSLAGAGKRTIAAARDISVSAASDRLRAAEAKAAKILAGRYPHLIREEN